MSAGTLDDDDDELLDDVLLLDDLSLDDPHPASASSAARARSITALVVVVFLLCKDMEVFSSVRGNGLVRRGRGARLFLQLGGSLVSVARGPSGAPQAALRHVG